MGEASAYDRPPTPDDEDPRAFFSERGYELRVDELSGVWSAALVAVDNPDFVVDAYGRSTNGPDRAELAAMRRWKVEQAT